MPSLEDRLRPSPPEFPWRGDLLGLALMGLLAMLLLPPWTAGRGERACMPEAASLMGSYYLLPALGFLLALRAGVIDLSVWVSASVGGVVAAAAINGGRDPATAMALGAASGLAMGLLGGAATAYARIPGPLATLALALAATWILAAVPGGRMEIPPETFDGWHVTQKVTILEDAPGVGARPVVVEHAFPLPVTRLLMVVSIFSAAVTGLFLIETAERAGARVGPRGRIVAALGTSGLLSALGGCCWLLEYGQAPAPLRPVGDLRIPAAALLAGGLYFSGRTRTLLTAAALPPCLLLATLWQQRVWNVQMQGYAMQAALLAAMTVTAHAAMKGISSRRKRLWALYPVSLGLTASGMVLLTTGSGPAVRGACSAAGAAAWVAGAVLLVIARLRGDSAVPADAA